MKASFALLLRVCAFAIAAVTALTALGCGAGGGKEREVPPGPATSAPPGNVVMYVSEGQGNRVAAYRLGTDGLPPAEPFSTIPLINPRRLLLVDDVLYVCLIDNVVSIEIEPDGSLPDLPTSITPPIAGIDAIDMVKVGDVLYVALEGLRVVAAYPLQNGQLTSESLSFSGTNLSDYRSIANRGPFIYAGWVDAADDTMALHFACEHYGQDQECVRVCAIARSSLASTDGLYPSIEYWISEPSSMKSAKFFSVSLACFSIKKRSRKRYGLVKWMPN